VIRLYDEFLGKPNSELAHHLLHTYFTDRAKAPDPETISQIWKLVKLG
jgi:ferredoxin hydrogenase gamma subunit